MDDQRNHMLQRRIDLMEEIKRGEDNLFASSDDRTRRALDQKLTALHNELAELNASIANASRETMTDFFKRHGHDYIIHEGKWLFPDGTIMDSSSTIYREPGQDKESSLKARRWYVQVKLDKEVEAFKRFQNECTEMANWAKANPSMCPPPPANAAEQLKAGKKRIDALRKQLAKMDRELDKMPEAIARRARQAHELERMAAIDDQLRELLAVTI